MEACQLWFCFVLLLIFIMFTRSFSLFCYCINYFKMLNKGLLYFWSGLYLHSISASVLVRVRYGNWENRDFAVFDLLILLGKTFVDHK